MTFRFRTEISERSLVAMTTNIPVIDQIHQYHPHLKATPEPGEGQPSAPVLTIKTPWKPSLPLENTWAEGMVDAGFSTTAPSTQASQANMPGSSSIVSGTSSVGGQNRVDQGLSGRFERFFAQGRASSKRRGATLSQCDSAGRTGRRRIPRFPRSPGGPRDGRRRWCTHSDRRIMA